MSSVASNEITYLLATKIIDFSPAADVFKIALMADGFTFDEDNHEIWGDVSGSELGAGNGYAANGNTLAGVAVTKDDVNNRTNITWDNTSWTASGGPIGPSPGAIIYDDTVGAPVKPIIGYIDFSGNRTQADGGIATIADPEVRIGKPSS